VRPKVANQKKGKEIIGKRGFRDAGEQDIKSIKDKKRA